MLTTTPAANDIHNQTMSFAITFFIQRPVFLEMRVLAPIGNIETNSRLKLSAPSWGTAARLIGAAS
jgi:hypothetical protein